MEVQSFGPSNLRIRASLAPENEPMQTRSIEPVRLMTSTSGSTALSSFGSMLIFTSGSAPSKSSISGIGSRPATLAALTVA